MAYENIKTALKTIGFSSELIDLFFDSTIAKENSEHYNCIDSKISTSFHEIQKHFFSLLSLLVGFSLSTQSGAEFNEELRASAYWWLQGMSGSIYDFRARFYRIERDYFISKKFNLYTPILKSPTQPSDAALVAAVNPSLSSRKAGYDKLKGVLQEMGFSGKLIDLFFETNPDTRYPSIYDLISAHTHFNNFKDAFCDIVSQLVGFSFAFQYRGINKCSGKRVEDDTWGILQLNYRAIHSYRDFFIYGFCKINHTNFVPKGMDIYAKYLDEEASLRAPVDDRAIAQPAVSAAQSQVAIPAAKPVSAETPSLAKVASCSVASPLTSVAMLSATPSAGDAEVPANAGDQVSDAAGSSLAPHYEGFFTGLPPEVLDTEKSLRYLLIKQCNIIIANLEKEINSRSKLSKFFSFAPDLRPLHIQALKIFVELLKKHILRPVESLDLIVKSYPAFGSEKRMQPLLSSIKEDQFFAMDRHSTDEQMRAAANFVYENNAEFVHNHASEYSGLSLQASC